LKTDSPPPFQPPPNVEVLPTSTYNVSPDVTDAVTLAVPPFPPAVSESLAPDAPTADICTLDTPVGTSNVCAASVPENEHVTVPPTPSSSTAATPPPTPRAQTPTTPTTPLSHPTTPHPNDAADAKNEAKP
jgi:hypothetical protein